MKITAAGSLPGTDFRGALLAMAEALPELLPLPELPARGVDLIGRTIGLIDGLGFDLQPAGWRLTAHPSADQRRASALWRRDLDDTEELLQGFTGVLKVAVAGPWTLAARIEQPRSEVLLADHGARREVAQALVEAVAQLRAELARRLPAAQVRFQIDEPMLVVIGDARVPTASGLFKHRGVAPSELAEALKPLAKDAILHCCAAGRWLAIARQAGFNTIWQDARFVDVDDLASWHHEGGETVLGVVDTASLSPQSVDTLVRASLKPLRLAEISSSQSVLLGTACGFAGWQQRDVIAQLEALRRAASLVAEALEHG